MALSKLVFWYQRKIGTYDKQQWERTVEQKIFKGLNQVPMRTAKLKTDLIDVDLVRGSLFPKTKAKHGIARVSYQALKRILFLPLYSQWWIKQTNVYTYVFFILLYLLQLLNMYLYYTYLAKESESETISCSEVLMPSLMMLTLCIVHSQIVATNPGPQLSSSKKTQDKQTRRPRFRSRFRSRGERDCRNFNNSSESKLLDSSSDKPSGEEEIEAPSVNKEIRNITNLATIFVKSAWKNGDTNSEDIKEKEEVNGHQQDDDGFESLNGNVSSDNDKIKNVTDAKENEMNITNLVKNGFKLRTSYSRVTGFEEKNLSNHLKKECESEEEGECDDILSKGISEGSNSALEWIGATTNSDECSYSSEVEESDIQSETNETMDLFSWDCDNPSSILLCSNPASSDRVTCTIWENQEIKKAELSVLDISSAIISRVEAMPENVENIYAGLFFAIFLSLLPSLRRISNPFSVDPPNGIMNTLVLDDLHKIVNKTVNSETCADALSKIMNDVLGSTLLDRVVILISAFERFILATMIICLLAVAERTFKQRFLYAKLFSHLTSSRRARKSDLPHFRLNKVRNIKTWLSVRSYLKRRGPQRSVDVIVSSVFILTLALLSFVSSELLKDIENLHSSYNIEALLWSFCLGLFILRFMTLGTKINKKYRNLSVLTTEQINLYLQIEQKPHKKEELMVANSVLKLAADLIKELESPFKISGLSANPYLYTITKVVLLSALSGVLSELLGFKLKLHKIKIK